MRSELCQTGGAELDLGNRCSSPKNANVGNELLTALSALRDRKTEKPRLVAGPLCSDVRDIRARQLHRSDRLSQGWRRAFAAISAVFLRTMFPQVLADEKEDLGSKDRGPARAHHRHAP